MFRSPKGDSRFSWTSHVVEKMRQYGISESRIRRIVRHPARIEEGIVPDTIAVMQPGGSTRYHEIWVMYRLEKKKDKGQKKKERMSEESPFARMPRSTGKIKVITTWRYPGKSPERNAVPDKVLREVQGLL